MIISKKKKLVASTHVVQTVVALMVVKLENVVVAVVEMAAVMTLKIAAKLQLRTSDSIISSQFLNLQRSSSLASLEIK